MVDDAIQAGIFNDLGSGSNVDVCIIRNDGTTQMIRNKHDQKLNGKMYARKRSVTFPRGTTEILKEVTASPHPKRNAY
jgi:20S proteasome subunit beta 2